MVQRQPHGPGVRVGHPGAALTGARIRTNPLALVLSITVWAGQPHQPWVEDGDFVRPKTLGTLSKLSEVGIRQWMSSIAWFLR